MAKNIPGKVLIKDLLVQAHIGLTDSEREVLQDILINIEISVDFLSSIESENIDDTINYSLVRKDILEIVRSNQYILLEKLCDDIASHVLRNKLVTKTLVRVEKPNKYADCRSVGVEIEKSR